MKDYVLKYRRGPTLPIAEIPTADLNDWLSRLAAGQVKNRGLNPGAKLEDVVERVNIELLIRELKL